MKHQDRTGFARSVIAMAVAMTAAQAMAQTAEAPRAKDDAVRIGSIVITGAGDRLGTGQMLNEDTAKSRSTVTKAATEKDLATSNTYQALSLLPGVNTFNHDATGLFGGGITIRGFNSDQLGFTINGVPVNDSGNYAVFPQEYTDQENVCTQTLAQGAPDVESPHIGATGGSIGIITCDPEDKHRGRFTQTLGERNLSRTFLRVDSGRFADNKAKVFVSLSHSQADKWKGAGKAKRDHLDTAFSFDLSSNVRVVGSLLYNRAVNNNIGTLSVAQLAANGYFWDFSTTFTPGHLTPVAGTAQKETGPTPQFYKLALNPFENAIGSISAVVRLAESTQLKVQPYMWYGYGTGGVQQRAFSETGFLNTTTGKIGAGVDLNGDGDTLDTVVIANSSVTRTQRPGVTAELSHIVGSHQLKFGLWYERAQHRQTGPGVAVDAEGNPADVWLRNGQIRRPDGTPFESRDWLTVSPSQQVYVADNFSFLNDQGLLSVAVRAPHITRKFTNYPSEAGGASLVGYTFEKSYSDVLPQVGLRFNLSKEQQLFAAVAKNFRAPPNFAFAPTNNNVVVTGGVPTLAGVVEAETSITTDLGYRFQSKLGSLSATLFNVDFKNRQANAYDPVLDKSIYTNAGNVNNRGLELEAGTAVYGGFSAYASLTYQKSKVKSDITVAKNQTIATTGKEFPLTPGQMAGLSVQWADGPMYVRVKAKYHGKQYATLMNDEEVPSYTVGELAAGYKLPDMGMMKNMQLRLNVSNIGNTRYRNPSSGSVVNAVKVGNTNPGTVFYYLGAPRMASLSFSADFQ